jgi:L-ascorbate metabolism protein UlaG (beta-lactamase superfamily)
MQLYIQKGRQKMKVATMVGVMCLVLVLAASAAIAGDEGTKAAQSLDMKTLLAGVVHLTDDDVRFRTKSGLCVFVDPVNGPNDTMVVASGMVKPDLILITHRHGDHFQPGVLMKYVRLNPTAVIAGPADVAAASAGKKITVATVAPGQDYTMAGIDFTTVPSYFGNPNSGHPKEKGWVGYVIKIDGARYYVTGDTEPLAEMAEVKADVIFPLLAGCGGNIKQAVKMAETSGARIVVPVHFHSGPGTPVTEAEEATANKYLAELPKGVQVAYFKDGKLTTGCEAKANGEANACPQK